MHSGRRFSVLLLALLLGAAGVAAAPSPELSAAPPPARTKAPAAVKSAPAGDLPRQGGDTIADAVVIAVPTHDLAGTTAGYTDDYDEVCPYSNSTSPDVVYTFTPPSTTALTIDMLGSLYDTKIYVYDGNLALVACNDDYYSDYVSKLENVLVDGGEPYFLVIDGYGGDFGDYLLNVVEFEPCELEVPTGASEEMEPPLTDDYVDWHNGGCNTDESVPPFQPNWMGGYFHGRSGWFLSQGAPNRDTDWFVLEIPYGGYLEIEGNAEHPCYMFELSPRDCGGVGVVQDLTIGPCDWERMTIVGPAHSPVWFWVGPTVFSPPDGFVGHEFDYLLFQYGGAVQTQTSTWSAVRDLYR